MAAAVPWPHPTVRASKRLAPRRSSGSPASPWDRSARQPRSVSSSENRRPDAPWHRLRLGAAITVEHRPDASEGEQRSVVVECEPHHILFLGLWVRLRRVFGETVGRDKAAVLTL